MRELRRPSPESLMLHRDLEKAKESLRQEQVVSNQQKQLLEARLKEEVRCCHEVVIHCHKVVIHAIILFFLCET